MHGDRVLVPMQRSIIFAPVAAGGGPQHLLQGFALRSARHRDRSSKGSCAEQSLQHEKGYSVDSRREK